MSANLQKFVTWLTEYFNGRGNNSITLSRLVIALDGVHKKGVDRPRRLLWTVRGARQSAVKKKISVTLE